MYMVWVIEITVEKTTTLYIQIYIYINASKFIPFMEYLGINRSTQQHDIQKQQVYIYKSYLKKYVNKTVAVQKFNMQSGLIN